MVPSLAHLAACLALAGGQDHGAAPPAPAAATPRPTKNVFLITVDTLRADHLGVYGYPRQTSPHLDRFARKNVLFEQAIVQWPKTSPSFASMLTGLYPQSTGLVRTCKIVVPAEHVLVAERFRAAGYKTLAVVSNPNLDPVFGFDQGFDDYSAGWKQEDKSKARTRTKLGGPACFSRYISTHAIAAVERAGVERGLFAWFHYCDPHAPYKPPEEYRDLFVGDPWYDAAAFAPLHPPDKALNPFGGIPPHAQLEGRRELAWYVAQYDATIRATDEHVHLLLEELGRRGLLEDALVVITADHGESIGEHDYWCDHGALPYDDCARVPLILRVPGLEAPVAIEQPVGLIDLVPTLLSFAGLPPDPALQGRDLLPVIRGEEAPADFVVFGSGNTAEYQHSIRTGRFKLTWVPDPKDQGRMTGAEYELYDLVDDPRELRNLAAERPEIVERLRDRLFRWLAEHRERRSVAGAGGEATLDEKTLEKLRELGYIESP